MRQAGRYLPEYRAIRAKVDFLTLCKTPELAAEVTIQPVEILGVDAAILFSDILVVPEAMGMELRLTESTGPVFPEPIRSKAQVERLRVPDPSEKLQFVLDALKLVRPRLEGRVPLIGFAGAPWTLATYMVEGGSSKDFKQIKRLVSDEAKAAHLLLEKLAASVTAFLNAQIASGAQAVQIFDTWAGLLTPEDFKEFSLGYIRRVIEGLNRNRAPVIVFAKGAGHSLEEIAESGCDVVALDWTVDIGEARRRIGGRVALQGNLHPCMLYARPTQIREAVKAILKKFGPGSGHIFNLGHGILPDTPVAHAKAFVQAVKEESVAYHAAETDHT